MNHMDTVPSNITTPHKENVVHRFIKSFMGAVSALTVGHIASSLLSKKDLIKEDVVSQLGIDAVAASIFAAYESCKVTEQNKKVDSFVKKYEQEKAVGVTSSTYHF